MHRLDQYGQSVTLVSLLLLPLAGLFGLISGLRRWCYRRGLLPSVRLSVPVIVIGNIRVGGSGKSPLVSWLAGQLRQHGHKPGIIARGHGGRAASWPQRVTAASDPAQVGDEPVMLAQQTGCPVWVGPDRVAAAQALLAEQECDLLITDDGLQHYRLQRDLEIALIDGDRRHGNGLLLPAGPLREPVSRLCSVDWRIAKGKAAPGEIAMALALGDAISLTEPDRSRPLAEFLGQPVHALAGIGHPDSFFCLLKAQGLQLIEHPFADHHAFGPADIVFDDDKAVLMTHKDAVKCRSIANRQHWYVPLHAHLPQTFIAEVERTLQGLHSATQSI